MPFCTNCGQPVKGAVCPHCQTPLTARAQANEADNDGSELYKGFLDHEETAIFNQYLRLIQSGLLEVVAMDSLGTDNKLDPDDIKSIVKRGLKALQSAQERARKEAEQEARRRAKESRKAVQREKKRMSTLQSDQTRRKARNIQLSRLLHGWPRWFLLAALMVMAGLGLFWFAASSETEPLPLPSPAPAPAPPPLLAVRENIYLRQSQVACQSPQALAEITRLAQNRESYARMLNSGNCFVSRSDIELTGLKPSGGSVMEGRNQAGELLYFHDFSLGREAARP
jgi:hypothetical protein